MGVTGDTLPLRCVVCRRGRFKLLNGELERWCVMAFDGLDWAVCAGCVPRFRRLAKALETCALAGEVMERLLRGPVAS